MVKVNKIRQLLALLLVAAAAALVVTIVLRSSRRTPTGENHSRMPANIDVALQQLHYTETKGGVKRWDLVAKRAEYDRSRGVVNLTSVRLVVAGNRQTGDITLDAARADYETQTKNIRLSGGVAAKSASGMEFTTGQAEFLAARSLIRTADRVSYRDRRLRVEGKGMELSTDTRDLHLLNDVTAEVKGGAGQ